jgi:PAS domain S-box-containing protein
MSRSSDAARGDGNARTQRRGPAHDGAPLDDGASLDDGARASSAPPADALPVPLVGVGPDLAVLSWNAAASEAYGWTAAEILGRPATVLAAPGGERGMQLLLERVLQGEPVHDLRTERRTRDGRILEVSTSLAPLRDAAGRVSSVCMVLTDQTARARREDAREAERRALLAALSSGRSARGLEGLLESGEGLVGEGKHLLLLILSEDQRRVTEVVATWLSAAARDVLRMPVDAIPAVGEALRSGRPVACADLSGALEWGALGADLLQAGASAATLWPLPHGREGLVGVFGLVGFGKRKPTEDDVDLLRPLSRAAAVVLGGRRTLAAHRARERLLATVNRVQAELSAELRTDRVVDLATSEARAMIGAEVGIFFQPVRAGSQELEPAQASGAPREAISSSPRLRPTDLLGDPFDGTRALLVHDLRADERFGPASPVAGLLSGSLPLRSYLAVPVLSRGGDLLGVLAFGHQAVGVFSAEQARLAEGVATQAALALDNAAAYSTVRSQAQALSEADRKKNDFLALLGHELRNPLGAIRNAAHLLLADPLTGSESEATLLQIIDRQARQMQRLVEDLLDITRITQGSLTIRRAALRVSDVLTHALRTAAPRLESRRQRVETLRAGPDLVLVGDAARLEQVLVNLIVNASKYSPVGSTIRLEALADGTQAVVRVEDEGPGIPPDERERVFQPFVRLPGIRGEGLGIGLSLVREILRLHGGTIELASGRNGTGTAAVLRLPRVVDGRPLPVTEETRAREACPSLKVVVVDDQLDARTSLQLCLERDGHHVVLCSTAAEALERTPAELPDVVLLDIDLPDGNGWDVATALRRHPSVAETPIYAVTGHAREEDRDRSHAAALTGHLIKPVDLDVLRDLLAGIRGRRPA